MRHPTGILAIQEQQLVELEEDLIQTRMTLGEHLEELRRRILYALGGLLPAMAISLYFGTDILRLLQYPYIQAARNVGVDPVMAAPTLTAGFTAYFRIAFIAGLSLSSLWIFYQMWQFVAAGLYPKERRAVLLAVPFSALLFVAGASFFLFVAGVPAMSFLLGFNAKVNLQQFTMFADYVEFVTNLMLVFGLAFQTPLVVLVLSKTGIVSLDTFKRYRRHVIIGVLIVSGIATPSPSPIDQLALALPIWLLFELGLVLGRLLGRRESV